MSRRTASDIEDLRQQASDAAWANARKDSAGRRADSKRELLERRGIAALAAVMRGRPVWYADAACKGRTDLMFEIPAHVGPALEVCAACPVREPCRAAGREGREFGVWGAETEVDRARAGRGNYLMTGTAHRAHYERGAG